MRCSAVVAVINMRGTRGSADVQNWSTAIKVGALLIMSAVLIVSRRAAPAAAAPFWPESVTPSLVSGMGLAMIGVLWAYEGWQYVTFSAGEAMNPQRTFPRAIVLGHGVARLGSTCSPTSAYLAALGTDGVARSDRVAAEAVGAIVGPGAAKLIAAAILVSIFSAMNGITITTPRVYYAMARDGLFFREARRRASSIRHAGGEHHRRDTLGDGPGGVRDVRTAAHLRGVRRLDFLCARRRVCVRAAPHAAGAERPFRVPGYPWTPLLFILAAAALVVNTIATQPVRAAIGIGVVLLGFPVFFVLAASWVRRTLKSAL